MELLILVVSMSGTVSNPGIRRNMNKLAYLEIVLQFLDLGWNCFGLYSIFGRQNACQTVQKTLITMVAIWGMITNASFFIVISILYLVSERSAHVKQSSTYMELWRRRINYLFGGAHQREKEGKKVVSEVAHEFADFFNELETDWAPTDILVGLVLLKREQKLVRESKEIQKTVPEHNWQVPKADRFHGLREYMELKRQRRHSRDASNNDIMTLESPKLEITESVQEITLDIESPKLSPISTSQSTTTTPITNQPEDYKPVERTILTVTEEEEEEEDDTKGYHPPKPIVAITRTSVDCSPNREKDAKAKARLSTSSRPVNTRQSFDVTAQVTPFTPSTQKLQTEPRTPIKRMSFDYQNLKETRRISSFKSSSISTSTFLKSTASFVALDKETKGPITKGDIWDIIHFSNYANLAYLEFDPEKDKLSDIIISKSNKNELFHCPYMISYDHDWKTLVISIRGTFSAADVLVDLKCNLSPIEDGDETILVHSGMLKTATNIYQKLLQDKILENHRNGLFSSYRIVLCGHSLGAGVAALVCHKLINTGFPSSRAYCYAAPGALCNQNAAVLFGKFCISVVCGDDLISRVSRYCMDILKQDLKRILRGCDKPKYAVITSIFFNMLSTSSKTKTLQQKDPEQLKATIKKIQMETASLPSDWRGENGHVDVESNATPTFMPGKILYIEKLRNFAGISGEKTSKKIKNLKGNASLTVIKERLSHQFASGIVKRDEKYVYVPRWANREEFHQILVSRSMMSDHSPFGILREFEDSPDGVALCTKS